MKQITEGRLLRRIEPYYFFIFLFINAIPVLFCKFFPTVDGAAHLYNSNLILDLVKHANSPIHNYFEFNNNINPNSSGHFILTLFLSVFPAFLAEKFILLIYLMGLPISLRYLLKSFSINNIFAVYLIFPFTYSFFFYYGFFNFNLAIVFFIIGISFWYKNKDDFNFKKIIVLAILSTIICLSHLFVFAIYLLFIFIFNIHVLMSKTKPKNIIRYAGMQLLSISIGLLIMFSYLVNSHQTHPIFCYSTLKDVLDLILDVMPAKGINYGKAGIFTKWILIILVACLSYLTLAYVYGIKSKKKIVLKNKIWLILTFAIALVLFVMPDSDGGAIGFVSARLVLFFYIGIIVWLASQEYNLWFKILIFLTINYINFSLLLLNYNSIQKESNLANAIYSSAIYLKADAIVYPILNSDDFLHAHISNYLGVEKPLIILENYEAALNHFPLKWKKNKFNLLPTSIKLDNTCNTYTNLITNEEQVDYVFMLEGEHKILTIECSTVINKFLKLHFDLIFTNGDKTISLYKRKNIIAYAVAHLQTSSINP